MRHDGMIYAYGRLVVLAILCCLGSLTTLAQDSVFTARVVEAETGEPLPMVGVYVSEDVNTLTNFDGEFSLGAAPDDMVRFTCIGRRTQTFRASELPAVIRMPMLERVMSEVTVTGVESMLRKIANKMEKDYNRHKKKATQYFYRQTSVMSSKQDIVEAFVGARPAVNLHDVTFLSGRHGAVSRKHWEQSALRNMNLHHIIELGAMTVETPFWQNLVSPLPSSRLRSVRGEEDGKSFVITPERVSFISYLQKLYDITVDELDNDGTPILAIALSLREGIKLSQPVLTGTLYVEKKSQRVLAFDGRVENMLIQLRRSELQSPINVPVAMKFHIDYRHDHKYAEVADLSMDTDWNIQGFDASELPLLAQLNSFQTRTLLFNVDMQKRTKRSRKKAVKASENMLAAIDAAGYDSTFWANNDVVKRTAEEEAIANGTIDREQALRDSLNAYIEGLSPVARLADRLKRFGRAIPQEKVYVHMDNTGYFLGDTIWFAAYTRKTNTDTPSRMSRVLYAELWNHDGYLVERKLIEMQDGRGHGFFALPDTLYSGYFELRAYTRWQLNWGQTEHAHHWGTEYQFFNKAMAKDFFRDYEKLYSRVFPVYDKPKEEGDFYKDMTFRPLRRYFKSDPKAPELRLSLFPEGGNLVAGVPCRVAFEAATSEGEVKEGRLSLLRSKQKTLSPLPHKGGEPRSAQEVLSVRTENRGRGTFTFTPEEGVEYEAVFEVGTDSPPPSGHPLSFNEGEVTPKNKKAKQGRSLSPSLKERGAGGESAGSVRQKIKAVKPEGVALQVNLDTLSGTWRFDIAARGKAAEQPLGVTVMNEGKVVLFEEIAPEARSEELSLRGGIAAPQRNTSNSDSASEGSNSVGMSHNSMAAGHNSAAQPQFLTLLPEQAKEPGVYQITVFDSIGHIYADRLFFVTRPDLTQSTLQFTGIKDQYKPFEPIEFDVTAADILPDMTVSLAVRDAVHTDNTFDTGNIMTEMLLSSEIKGFVPQPEYFFERDDEEHRRALDLLMMTQGWRRFNWQDMAVTGAWELTQPAEHTQMVSGTVNRYSIYDEEATFDSRYLNGGIGAYNGHYFDVGNEGWMNYASGLTRSEYWGQSRRVGTYREDPYDNWGNRTYSSRTTEKLRTSLGLDMSSVFQSRSNIGAIADIENGVYGEQGHSWLNTDYNVLNFKTDNRYRSTLKERMSIAARRYIEEGNLKRDVTVHAEFINPFKKNDVLVGESTTNYGRFTIDLPRFTGECYFHLAAADTSKWHSEIKPKRAREDRKAWIKIETSTPYDMVSYATANNSSFSLMWADMGVVNRVGGSTTTVRTDPFMITRAPVFVPDVPEYYVRINFPYPRWIKPYTYYQVHNAPLPEHNHIPAQLITDGVHLLDQVTIRMKHGGLRHIDYSKPAYVIDAYDAANLCVDAGLMQYTFYADRTAADLVTVLMGDMGMARRFSRKLSINQHSAGYTWGPVEEQRNRMLSFMDKMYVYTDYSPRREGDERYEQSNQPEVRVDMRRMPEGEERAIFVNRHLVLPGFAYQEDFYHPDYKRNPPVEGQKDYRRTLYWNPELKLDKRGQAHVRLFNNSQYTSLLIEAEGQTDAGGLLFGR